MGVVATGSTVLPGIPGAAQGAGTRNRRPDAAKAWIPGSLPPKLSQAASLDRTLASPTTTCRMSQPEPATLEATVREALPNARFRVALAQGEEILAHVSGKMRMQVVRILPGDRVVIQISPFDRTLGRIVGTHPTHLPSNPASNPRDPASGTER